MQPVTLTRGQYNAAVQRAFARLRAATGRDVSIPTQYPKDRLEAAREVHFRGCYVHPDFGSLDNRFTAAELDRVVAALESADQLTSEARQAKAAGMSLAQWMEANPDE